LAGLPPISVLRKTSGLTLVFRRKLIPSTMFSLILRKHRSPGHTRRAPQSLNFRYEFINLIFNSLNMATEVISMICLQQANMSNKCMK
jgi:hypothetical protein